MNSHPANIIKAISEEIALARPRTKKIQNEMARVFGDKLIQMRKARGLSQVELAEASGLYQADISDFERGDRCPDTRNVVTLAKVLKVSMDELLGLRKAKTKSQPLASRKVLRRLRRIEGLPKRDRQALLRTLDNILAGASHNRLHAA